MIDITSTLLVHFLLPEDHTYLNCSAVTQHWGAGWPRVTHVCVGWVSADRHLQWAFFHKCSVTWQSTCCASKSGQPGGSGGLEGSGQSSPSSFLPAVQTTRWRKKRRNHNLVRHEKESWTLSPYSQFPAALPPSSPALICIPRGTSSSTAVFSLSTPQIAQIATKHMYVPDSLRKNIRIRDGFI